LAISVFKYSYKLHNLYSVEEYHDCQRWTGEDVEGPGKTEICQDNLSQDRYSNKK